MREYVRLPNDCAIFGRVCPPFNTHRYKGKTALLKPVTVPIALASSAR